MNEQLAAALHRTLLLMRDEFRPEVDDGALLNALVGTRVALIADEANINSHSAQTAFITAAILMARSGHTVHLFAPDIDIIGPQPPLQKGALIEQLLTLGRDMLPGIEFTTKKPKHQLDLAISLGNSPVTVSVQRILHLNCGHWVGSIDPPTNAHRWEHSDWPFGALVAAALGAAEAFKVAIHKLLHLSADRENTRARFAFSSEAHFRLAPEQTSVTNALKILDVVSGGAISHAVLYCLARILGVTGGGRVFEPDTADVSNLNRYMFLRRSDHERSKAKLLSDILPPGLKLGAIESRFDAKIADSLGTLAPMVLVGVDHIPSRWAVQEQRPEWLAIGATSHWAAMASFHTGNLGCARCLHHCDDDIVGLLPTCALTSFWAGLLVAAYAVRLASGDSLGEVEQQVFMTPFRPEKPYIAAVQRRMKCRSCSQVRAVA